VNDILIATPTYNEAGNIAALLRQLAALGLAADYLVVDDGSTDGTPDIVLRLAAEIPQLKLMQRGSKQGVGSAHIDALKYAKSNGYRKLVTLDADFSHQPTDVPRLLAASSDFQVVLGTRFSDPRSLEEWSPLRKAITHFGHFLTRVLLHIPYDASGGLRVYDLRAISMSLIQSIRGTDYEFFFESITLFDMAGLRIGEVPIKLPARAYGHSKMQVGHAVKGLQRLIVLASNLSLARKRARAAMQTETVQND